MPPASLNGCVRAVGIQPAAVPQGGGKAEVHRRGRHYQNRAGRRASGEGGAQTEPTKAVSWSCATMRVAAHAASGPKTTKIRTCAAGTIRAVAEASKVPVIKHFKGVCHVYVDAEAELSMAEEIALNAKVQRPAVCNAMETLLVDKRVAAKFLPAIAKRLGVHKLELRCDELSLNILKATSATEGLSLRPATDPDFFTE